MASAQELPSLVPPSYTLTTPVIVQRLAMGLFLVAGTTGVSRAAAAFVQGAMTTPHCASMGSDSIDAFGSNRV